ncbi:MAG: hypothetical protein UHS49_00210 [Faecalimonas sp.]|nr:hypothetical protein [Faecalimonas sp.]
MAGNSVDNAINKVKLIAVMQKVFGWIIAIFNGFVALVGATQITEALDVAIVIFFAGMMILGIALIIKGNRKTKLIKMFHNYSARLFFDSEKSIDLLAASTGATVKETTKNLSDMISVGFFPNYYIDKQYNRLIEHNKNRFFKSQAMSMQSQKDIEYVTVQCKGCGAINKIVAGGVGECEFCGSQLSQN